MGVQRRLIVPAAAFAAALALGACGSDDFENNPRPASPIELSARIGDREISVSPSTATSVGAGIATITISNQTNDPTRLVLEGPSDESSAEIVPQGTGEMKIVLEEGDYTVSAADIDAPEAKLEVGPDRESSQNDLLLP